MANKIFAEEKVDYIKEDYVCADLWKTIQLQLGPSGLGHRSKN